MNETTEYEFERLIDKDKFTGRAETEARLDQEHIERAAVLDRAFFDDSVDIIDYKILNLAAKSEEHTITPMDAYESIHERNHNIHPIVEEDIAHEKFLPRMRKLAEAKYLIEMKEENTREYLRTLNSILILNNGNRRTLLPINPQGRYRSAA